MRGLIADFLTAILYVIGRTKPTISMQGNMKHNKKKSNDDDDPKPINFDHDEEKGPSDHLEKTFMTPSEERGDNEDDQYYEEEEAISPEEVKERKEEDDL
jgi:hypothetical protein